MSFDFDVVSIFPELFPGPLSVGLVGKAFQAGRAVARYLNPRDYAFDKHQKVDDVPYGGGAGMVMKYEPLALAIAEVRRRGPGPVVLLTPQGRRLAQTDLTRWAAGSHLALVAGRYEGFDERLLSLVDEEISIGDFVLTGGEVPALAIIDGVVRLLPGTLGNADSPTHDSFQAGLLEHPHYTRPVSLPAGEVPELLSSGHHAQIARWRHQQSVLRTFERRPDLWLQAEGSAEDWALLRSHGAILELWLELQGSPSPGLLEALQTTQAALGFDGVRLLGPGFESVAGFQSNESLEAAQNACPEARIVTSFSPPPTARGLVRRAFVVFA